MTLKEFLEHYGTHSASMLIRHLAGVPNAFTVGPFAFEPPTEDAKTLAHELAENLISALEDAQDNKE